MKAKRVFYDKAVWPAGEVVEMVIWQLPEASPERPHGLKYSLFYGLDGERNVGYDNERGKGDTSTWVLTKPPTALSASKSWWPIFWPM